MGLRGSKPLTTASPEHGFPEGWADGPMREAPVDRDAKCLEVLAGKKKLGIFYGAAHFPDMEKRLLAGG